DKVAPLDHLMQVVEAFVASPGGEITGFELGERLIRLRHGIDLLELRFAHEAAVFAAGDEYEVQGSTSPIDWVRHQCRMSSTAAARSIATGEAAAELPASVAALEAGRLGFAHLSMLTGTKRVVRRTGERFDERPLLELALEHSVGRFAQDCDHARHAGDAASVLAEHVDAVDARYLELTKCEDGRLAVHGLLDPAGGPRCGWRWSPSVPARVPAMSVPVPAAWPTDSSSSPCMPSTTASPQSGLCPASSPKRTSSGVSILVWLAGHGASRL
ncbi:MAG: hypothetical protein ACHQ4F_14420, partial [Candidatus Dormibacteria bacterium]